MDRNIGIIGGDLRIKFLSQILINEGYHVYSYGLENEKEYNNTKVCDSISKMCNACDTIISSIPFSRDGININSTFSSKEINIDETFMILKNKILIAGAIKPKIRERARNYNIELIDLIDNESFNILNIIPTVEGAIQIAMENTKFTIYNSNSLILGFGRIGKLLSKTLKNLGSNVSVEARKESDLSWIKVNRYKEINLDKLNYNLNTHKYDIIFNTIPTLILNEERLKIIKEINKDTVILELASSPGGIDFKKADEYNLKVIKALGLPGIVAPYTAAEYIKESIEEILE